MTSCSLLQMDHKATQICRERMTTYSLWARAISQAWYTIFFPSGRNWLRYSTHWVYSTNNIDSRGTGSRFLTRLRMVIGAPYRRNKLSKCFDAAVKNGSTTLTIRNYSVHRYPDQSNGNTCSRWVALVSCCSSPEPRWQVYFHGIGHSSYNSD